MIACCQGKDSSYDPRTGYAQNEPIGGISTKAVFNPDQDQYSEDERKTVRFATNSSKLTPEYKAKLDKEVVQWLKDDKEVNVTVNGHTDERGSDKYNLALGKRRAASVKAYLVSKGIKADRISVKSYGSSVPLDPAHNEEAWSKNRRTVTTSKTK